MGSPAADRCPYPCQVQMDCCLVQLGRGPAGHLPGFLVLYTSVSRNPLGDPEIDSSKMAPSMRPNEGWCFHARTVSQGQCVLYGVAGTRPTGTGYGRLPPRDCRAAAAVAAGPSQQDGAVSRGWIGDSMPVTYAFSCCFEGIWANY